MRPHEGQNRFAGRLVTVIVVALLSTAAGRSGEVQEEPGNPRAGIKLIVDKGCMRCHSLWESTAKKGPSLASVGMGRNLYELCASVWSHWSKMNAAREQGKEAPIVLSSTEIRDIISYLYYLNYYREPGDEALGEKIFVERGCSQCHGVEPLSAEGKLGPPVYHMRDFQGPITLVVALWNHGADMLRGMAQRHIQWPQFQGKDVAHLARFIRSKNVESSGAQTTLPGKPPRGRELFISRSCATCHESSPGRAGTGPNLAASGTAASLSSLVAGLWNHYPKMAQAISSKGIAAGGMTTDEVEDLMAYLYWIKAYGLAGNPAAGRRLYQSKNCIACHTAAADKPAAAPSLVGSETTRSPHTMLAAIWNHGPRMDELLRQRNIPWPALNGEEMRDLIAFFQKDAR